MWEAKRPFLLRTRGSQVCCVYATGDLLLPNTCKCCAQFRLWRSPLRGSSRQVPTSPDRGSFLEKRCQGMTVLLVTLLGLVATLVVLAIYDPLSARVVKLAQRSCWFLWKHKDWQLFFYPSYTVPSLEGTGVLRACGASSAGEDDEGIPGRQTSFTFLL